MINSKAKQKQSANLNVLLIILIVFFIWLIWSFLIWPNLSVLRETFFTDGQLTLNAFEKIGKSDRALTSIRNSFVLGISLTVTVQIVGTFIVLATEYFDIKGAKILRIIFMSTLVFGGLLLNNGYLLVYGPNGIVTELLVKFFPNLNENWFQGFPAVLFVMTFACTSNHMLFLRNAIRSLDYSTVQAAQNLGASQWTILRKIVLPTLAPTLTTLTVMTFQIGLGALSAPLMVGGEDFQTIAPMILTFANRVNSRDIAAILALILGLAQIILLMVMTRNERKGNFLSISKTKTRFKKIKITNTFSNFIIHLITYILGIIYLIPLLMVIIFSFMDTTAISNNQISLSSFTFEHYITVLTDSDVIKPFLTSVIYSGLAALISVLLMSIVARIVTKYKNKLSIVFEYMFYIPWLVPSLFTALGLILGYSRGWPWMFNITLVGTYIIMLFGYIIEQLPSTLRYMKSAFYSFDENLEDASRNLGAGQFYTFRRIILPIVIPTALALFALNFNGKLADYDLSAFLYHPTLPTLGIMIRQNADPNASIDAKAVNLVYSVILMLISTSVLYLVYGRGTNRLSKRKGKHKLLPIENANQD